MTDNFKILVHKLNKFRKRYYLFKLLRGTLLTLVLSLVIYFVVSIIEYYSYLPPDVRLVEFYALIIFLVVIVFTYMFLPFLKLIRITKQISYPKLNSIIVNHFPEIKDKLLNIIELANSDDSQYSKEILWASIDQKINEIKVFDIKHAVNFKHLRYFLLYFLTSAVVIISVAVYKTPVLTESNYRILNYEQNFIKPAPYQFVILNNSLEVTKGENITISVNCKGDDFPRIVYINIEGNNYLMNEKQEGLFEYTIESCINSFNFFFTDLKYNSKNYLLKILPNPNITSFYVSIKPPGYTNLPAQVINNIGDLKIPVGTVLKWSFSCIDTDSLFIDFGEEGRVNAKNTGNSFIIEKNIYNNVNYDILLGNRIIENKNIITYTIDVINDSYPQIQVVRVRDSLHYSKFFFKGAIADDYGFTKLDFHYNVDGNDSIIPLQLFKNLTDQEFYFTFDFNQVNSSSKEITYYFTVTDNDYINHYKTTTSESFVYKLPTKEEIDLYDKEKFKSIEDFIIQSHDLANEIKKDLKNLKLKNLNANTTNWEKSQLVNDIINKKKMLEELVNQAKKNNMELNDYMNSFDKQSNEIVQKQEQLEKLLDEIFTDELKDLLEEFAELANEFDNNKLNKLSDDLDMSMDDLSKQLDRNLEILRKMKVEQKLQNIIDKTYQLSGDEESLAKELSKGRDFDKAIKKNTGYKDDFKLLQQQLDDALELNNKLEKPINFDDFDIEFDEIIKSFDNTNEQIQKKNRKKSTRGLQRSSEQLKNLAFNMKQMLEINKMRQNRENIENLKQILSNLLILSFGQEDILKELSQIQQNDPVLNELTRAQDNLQMQSVVIKDSLYALAKRIPQISTVVNNELLSMELNLGKSIASLEEGLIPSARGRQQFVITSANNLALLLSDILKQIQDQMANAMPGDQECENPGGKGSKMDLLKQSSEGIKQQLKKMIEELKKGNSGQMSKMLGQSLIQHEMMQQMLRDLINNGSVGSDATNLLKQIDKLLEQNRKELVNKNISAQTLMRQNQILTHLLQAEKAEMERDIEDKRESETAAEDFYSNPVKYFEYNKKDNIEIEKLKYKANKLNYYYNKKFKQYLNNVKDKSVAE